MKTSFPITINRKGTKVVLILGIFVCFIWWAFLFFMFHPDKMSGGDDLIQYIYYGAFIFTALFGLILPVIGIYQVYEERIIITQTNVSYIKKGWFRKAQNWVEPINNYRGISGMHETGVSSSGVNAEVDVDLFLVVLSHKTDKQKDVQLDKNAKSKELQVQIQEHYAKILNLPAI